MCLFVLCLVQHLLDNSRICAWPCIYLMYILISDTSQPLIWHQQQILRQLWTWTCALYSDIGHWCRMHRLSKIQTWDTNLEVCFNIPHIIYKCRKHGLVCWANMVRHGYLLVGRSVRDFVDWGQWHTISFIFLNQIIILKKLLRKYP